MRSVWPIRGKKRAFSVIGSGKVKQHLRTTAQHFTAPSIMTPLMAIRIDGHWEAWLKFFLKGVGEVRMDQHFP